MNEFYFLCKVKFDQMQENGSVKKVTEQHLVHANSVQAAHTLMDMYMKDTMSDYVIERIDETKIVDVFDVEIK